jgi:protein-disulfide isomerase
MQKNLASSFWVWPMLTGLLVGFITGRYLTPAADSGPSAGLAVAEVAGAGDRDNAGRQPPGAAAAAAPAAARAPAPPPAAGGGKRVVLAGHHPRKGPAVAKVTLVEFSDFQCPYCSRVTQLVEQITAAYPKDVAFVFVNFPLRSMHPHAAGAATAFLAAHRQGAAAGWRMHDQLFANQQALTPADLERHAAAAKLDLRRWKKDLADPAVARMLADDEALAMRLGVPGTPSFFVNGRELSGGLDNWRVLIDEELKRADAALAQGVKPADLYRHFLDQADKPITVEVGSAPSRGPAGAPVTIVAFSEFQCPYCSKALPGLKQVEDSYKGKVRIAFKNLLIPGHEQAPLAAEAALAAHEQGKFWPYHDKLFENQRALDRQSLERYAGELKLDLARFRQALDSGKHKKAVEADLAQAATLGASATPTFFVNGRKLMGAKDFPEWKAIIDDTLASAQ